MDENRDPEIDLWDSLLGNSKKKLESDVEVSEEELEPEVLNPDEELEPEVLNPEVESSDDEDRDHDGESADEEDSNDEEVSNLNGKFGFIRRSKSFYASTHLI